MNINKTPLKERKPGVLLGTGMKIPSAPFIPRPYKPKDW